MGTYSLLGRDCAWQRYKTERNSPAGASMRPLWRTLYNLAANSDIDDISLERLKGECVKEVKRLNGNFTFKDANDWQKGYYTKENDVEKEADTNSPWGDNLRASFVENCQDFCTIRLRRGRNI